MLGKVQKAQLNLAVAKAVVEDTIEPEVEKHTSHLAAAKTAILEDLRRGLGKEITTRSKMATIATKEDSNRENGAMFDKTDLVLEYSCRRLARYRGFRCGSLMD